MALRYDSKTWENRPQKSVWDKIRPYVGYQPGIADTSLPPIFGWCVGQLRVKYDIYVSVTPHVQTVSKGGLLTSELIFHFTGDVIKLENGKISKTMRYTGTDYVTVMNKCLELVGNYLASDEYANSSK